MDVPGISKDMIQVEIDDSGMLCLHGERKREKESKDFRRHTIERTFGEFNRRFSLPLDANKDMISAKVENGILEVTIPKKAMAAGKKAEPKCVPIL